MLRRTLNTFCSNSFLAQLSASSSSTLLSHSHLEKQNRELLPLKRATLRLSTQEMMLLRGGEEYESDLVKSVLKEGKQSASQALVQDPFQLFLAAIDPPTFLLRLAAFHELLIENNTDKQQQRSCFRLSLRAAREIGMYRKESASLVIRDPSLAVLLLEAAVADGAPSRCRRAILHAAEFLVSGTKAVVALATTIPSAEDIARLVVQIRREFSPPDHSGSSAHEEQVNSNAAEGVEKNKQAALDRVAETQRHISACVDRFFFSKQQKSTDGIEAAAVTITRKQLETVTAFCTKASFLELADIFAAYAVAVSSPDFFVSSSSLSSSSSEAGQREISTGAAGVLPFEFQSQLSSVSYVVIDRLRSLGRSARSIDHISSLEKIALAAAFLKQLHGDTELWRAISVCFGKMLTYLQERKSEQESLEFMKEIGTVRSCDGKEEAAAAAAATSVEATCIKQRDQHHHLAMKSARGILFAFKSRASALQQSLEDQKAAGKKITKAKAMILLRARKDFDEAETRVLSCFS